MKPTLSRFLTVALAWWLAGASASAQTSGILREVFAGIPGSTLFDLTNSPAFPNSPTSTNLVTDVFEAPTSFDDDYGQRMRGFILPPTTGNYIFWIASDDQSQLYLSTDEDPAHAAPVAGVLNWTDSRDWAAEPGQQSGPVRLVGGRRYYIEAVMKEGTGGDNLAVRWQLPGGQIEEPIPASRLQPPGAVTLPPVIRTHPANVIALEGEPAVFRVTLANVTPASYQWQRNSQILPGAITAAYTNPAVTLADDGTLYRVVITNVAGGVTSDEAVLAVRPDLTPPALLSVVALSNERLRITFSEPVLNATRANSYSLNNGIAVLSASYGDDTRAIILQTSPLGFRATYTLVVNGVTDAASARNPLPAGTRVDFTPVEFAPQDIGQPAQPGLINAAPDGFSFVAGGRDVGGTNDQFAFGFQQRSGNFDLQVRVQSLGLSDPWAKAGLMARESLAPGSRHASVLATPFLMGTFLQYRQQTNGATATTGTFPVNYPDTWLRLQRVGNLFTGFASADGESWTTLGSVNLPMTNQIYFGFAVASRNTNQTTVAEFRGLRNVVVSTNTPAGDFRSDAEPLGPSTRRTGLVVSEIMYHPPSRADGRNLEFVELCNTESIPLDLGGFRLDGAASYTLPERTVLQPGEFLVIAPAPGDIRAVYGPVRVLGGFASRLENSAGRIRVRTRSGGVLLEAVFSGAHPWPAAADGAGHSLVLARPSYGEGDPRAWSASELAGGSPGRAEPLRRDVYRGIVINEFLAHTDAPEEDYVEIYNHGARAVNLGECVLTDDPTVARHVLLRGLTLQPGGFAVFRQSQLGFALSAAGETIYLFNPDRSRVIDAVKFAPQANGISTGRSPDGAPGFYPLAAKSPGAANGAPLVSDVVINELMYHPLSENPDDEYVELYNRGTNAVDLGGWRFTAGVDFQFPAHTLIARGTYLVVARNADHLRVAYTNLNTTNLIGNFAGGLSRGGERIALARPEELVTTNANGTLATNLVHVVTDEVTWQDGGRWGKWADGGGSSLELVDARADHRQAANWAESEEAAKSEWTTIETTGLLDNGSPQFAPDHLGILLLGAGECLVDNVEVIGSGGVNLVPNPTFEGGLTGWIAQGTHVRSHLDAEGDHSSRSLRVVASARGDTGPNIVFAPLNTPLIPGTVATIRARVRWLRGNPEILLRLHGAYLEAAGRMAVPPNPGTPGARNSRALANAGPVIADVAHHPVLPAAFEPVRVTARVTDPDGVSAVTLRYRVDPSVTVLSTNMVDTGTNGDEVAGDGIYTATIPGNGVAKGTLVAFRVEAADNNRAKATSLFPANAPARECLVMYGETRSASTFGTYRIWFTQATQTEWENRGGGSNDPLDATFVYGDSRVIYNMETLYSGSPFHWGGYSGPLGGNCNYMMIFPADDLFLGQSDFVLNSPANLGNDNTAQREQTFFWIIDQLGQAYNHRRFHHLQVNGQVRGNAASAFIFEDAQQPNSDMLKEWFPDDPDGDLYKIEDWFEYDPAGLGFSNVDASLELFTTTGDEKKLARYRWGWRKRAVNGSAHNYTNLFNLVDALNTSNPEEITRQVEQTIDVDQWMTAMAMRHLVGDWDAYGYRRGKNMYAYKPQNGKWQLLHWDIAFSFGQGDGVTTDLFSTIEPVIRRLYAHPPFRRAYLQALQDAVNGPFQSEQADAIMDARFSAFQGNGLAITSPNTVKTWLRNRRTFVVQTLASNTAPFAITSQTAAGRNLVTLEGTAPLAVRTIDINGVAYPLTWRTPVSWSLTLPATGGTNHLALRGLDKRGTEVTNAVGSVTVVINGPVERPENFVVINEIMYHPPTPDAEYVELYNASTSQTFDLSDWQLNGVDFTFPPGTYLAADSYLVVVKDRAAFTLAYGTNALIAGVFAGQLDNGGESLSLIKPGATPATNLIVDTVTYDDSAPWPVVADGGGASLQLIDPRQSRQRAGNWAAVPPGSVANGDWQFVSVSGFASGSRLLLNLTGPGEVYLDDMALVAGVVPAQGVNLLANGDFESALTGTWSVPANLAGSEVSAAIKFSGHSSLRLVAATGGADISTALTQILPPGLSPGQIHTLSFWYLPSVKGNELVVKVQGDGIQNRVDTRPASIAAFTPGAVNSTRELITPFPALWLNEVQTVNAGGITDASGARAPWVELHNSGGVAVSLSGLYLSDNYTNLAGWPFPANATIQPGQYLVVWLDGLPGRTSATELHAGFRPGTKGGELALARDQNGRVAIVDYLSYPQLGADHSYGSLPDAQHKTHAVFSPATPGATNGSNAAPARVFINEWLAGNARSFPDPADGDHDDWFELYNAGSSVIDLGGYRLTDNLTNTTKYVIPAGVTIPAGGHLLVWADEETNQNGQGVNLHVNFKLSLAGEEIGLFAPNGTLIDAVHFGQQIEDVSQGRATDGASGVFINFTTPTPGGPNSGSSGGSGLSITAVAATPAGTLAITWSSEPGARYQLQTRDTLGNESSWTNLGAPVVATGGTTSSADPLGVTGRYRFYRVVRVISP